LFVITGGPGAGKTTVLTELAQRGFAVANEVAREIIQEQVRSGGSALPWKDRQLYADLMLMKSIESYKQHTPALRPTFSDRGIPDTLSYARLVGLANDIAMQEACHQYRYASRVFVAPPWEEIHRTDDERKQDFAEAVRTFEQITQTYRDCGYQLVELPKVAPGIRADFILSFLEMKP
jgi:predicted ATPase